MCAYVTSLPFSRSRSFRIGHRNEHVFSRDAKSFLKDGVNRGHMLDNFEKKNRYRRPCREKGACRPQPQPAVRRTTPASSIEDSRRNRRSADRSTRVRDCRRHNRNPNQARTLPRVWLQSERKHRRIHRASQANPVDKPRHACATCFTGCALPGLHSLRASLDGCALPGLHSLRASLDGCALPGLHSLRSCTAIINARFIVRHGIRLRPLRQHAWLGGWSGPTGELPLPGFAKEVVVVGTAELQSTRTPEAC